MERIIILIFISFLIAFIFGFSDSVTFSRKGSDAFKFYFHPIYPAMRVLSLLLSVIVNLNWLEFTMACLLMGSLHPFFYYEFRHKIEPNLETYKKGWLSEPSKSSKAWINLSVKVRTTGVIFSVILIIINQLML